MNELKLRSPAGSEPLIYTWPLYNRVSLAKVVRVYGREEQRLKMWPNYTDLRAVSCLWHSLIVVFRMGEMMLQKLWTPSGNNSQNHDKNIALIWFVRHLAPVFYETMLTNFKLSSSSPQMGLWRFSWTKVSSRKLYSS